MVLCNNCVCTKPVKSVVMYVHVLVYLFSVSMIFFWVLELFRECGILFYFYSTTSAYFRNHLRTVSCKHVMSLTMIVNWYFPFSLKYIHIFRATSIPNRTPASIGLGASTFCVCNFQLFRLKTIISLCMSELINRDDCTSHC